MNRCGNSLCAIGSLCLGLGLATPVRAASLQKVNASEWGVSGLPSYVTMYLYVPDRLASKPPLLVGCHSCGTSGTGYFGQLSGVKAAADSNGFILIIPEATGQNCWDAGSTKSLTHDGGGDTQAIAQMVRYALSKYQADATRVYVMGGSSGGMMTQALLGVYPDLFVAGAARAGVPAGCWAVSYSASNQWSGPCAGGQVTHTAQEWGNLVRAMYPGYTGHRPRVQLFQGTADETISFHNFGESIKEWTNVLGLSASPTSTDTTTSQGYTYDRQFWSSGCGYTVLEAWAAQNGKHSMPYEQPAILEFFGLDRAGGPDPELAACSADGGTGGTGTGGTGTGGRSGTGGRATGGRATGGVVSNGGVFASGGTGGASPVTGGSSGIGGTGGVTDPETCNCRTTNGGSGRARGWLLAFALLFARRARRRNSR